MKTITDIETRIDKLHDSNWLYMLGDTDTDEFVRITSENIEDAAKFYKVPEAFLEMVDDALRTMVNELIGELSLDLEDIWIRLDKLDGQRS